MGNSILAFFSSSFSSSENKEVDKSMQDIKEGKLDIINKIVNALKEKQVNYEILDEQIAMKFLIENINDNKIKDYLLKYENSVYYEELREYLHWKPDYSSNKPFSSEQLNDAKKLIETIESIIKHTPNLGW